MGGPQDEGALLLATTRTQWTVFRSYPLWMAHRLPSDGTSSQDYKSRVGSQASRGLVHSHFPGNIGSKLAETLQTLPRYYDLTSPPWFIFKKIY